MSRTSWFDSLRVFGTETAGELWGAGGGAWLVVGELCAAAIEPKHSSNIALLKEADLHVIASRPLTQNSNWEHSGKLKASR